MRETVELDLVQNADNMDTGVFELHMNRRHGESLGGLEYLSLGRCSEYVVLCWRLFHGTLHRIRHDIPHEHGEFHAEAEDG